ncbi:MAG TPA: Xaa-Pro peptidase family protein [Candidatus Acidoferrales bacterium]|nr:Xaa-Pro peptidase family protein [Candidatus Acidoferrales bacterium]
MTGASETAFNESEKAGRARRAARLSLLRQEMEAGRLDAFVVTHPPNVFYLSGFTGSAAVLVITKARLTLLTDARYTVQAPQEARDARVKIIRGSLTSAAGEELAHGRTRHVGFEAARLTVSQKSLLDEAAGSRVRWIIWDGRVEAARAVKDAAELNTMREAAAIACSSWQEILPLIKPGVLETDLAAEVEFRMRRKGASGPAFDTIIASGPRGALPHAHASARAVGKNELVVCDLGAILRGYSSDLTRTVFVGRAPKEVRRWYTAVLEAQGAARDVLSPGVSAQRVDAAARKTLQRAGLGKQFVHSTGHGLGLEVHEIPRLAKGQETVLRAGVVVTIEPGVYIEGKGGIRIEDDALVTPNGAEYLTDANRELIELG